MATKIIVIGRGASCPKCNKVNIYGRVNVVDKNDENAKHTHLDVIVELSI